MGSDDMLAHIRHCPAYGNDDDSVDWMMTDLTAACASLIDSTKTPRGGKFQFDLYSVVDHAKMGLLTGGLPDAKLSTAAFANASAPVHGKDISGLTAVINSVLKSDLSVATNGMVVDVKFHPTFFEKESHQKVFSALINTFFDKGGMEMQFNVIDRETLKDAQNILKSIGNWLSASPDSALISVFW